MRISDEAPVARAVADLPQGSLVATVDIVASPDRVFRALVSKEITEWWVRPGVFDTREWSGEVRVGGQWRASGIGRGTPYGLEGEFREVDSPGKLVHTWRAVGASEVPTTVTYVVEATAAGTHLTLRHEGFTSRDVCLNTAIGWETSLERLARILSHD